MSAESREGRDPPTGYETWEDFDQAKASWEERRAQRQAHGDAIQQSAMDLLQEAEVTAQEYDRYHELRLQLEKFINQRANMILRDKGSMATAHIPDGALVAKAAEADWAMGHKEEYDELCDLARRLNKRSAVVNVITGAAVATGAGGTYVDFGGALSGSPR